MALVSAERREESAPLAFSSRSNQPTSCLPGAAPHYTCYGAAVAAQQMPLPAWYAIACPWLLRVL
jgi:hypothetical protein